MRTCKHIKGLRGEEAERVRMAGVGGDTSSAEKITSTTSTTTTTTTTKKSKTTKSSAVENTTSDDKDPSIVKVHSANSTYHMNVILRIT